MTLVEGAPFFYFFTHYIVYTYIIPYIPFDAVLGKKSFNYYTKYKQKIINLLYKIQAKSL